jgi:hypothetical protein
MRGVIIKNAQIEDPSGAITGTELSVLTLIMMKKGLQDRDQ